MAEQKRGRGKRLSKEDVEYIRENVTSKTDQQIAKDLGCRVVTVANNRRKMGVYKSRGGEIQNDPESSDSSKAALSQSGMTEAEKKEFFKTQLVNSLYYKNLKKQLSEEEIDYYLQEWGALCVQFQDIVATEKRQIDELIKTYILDNRILRNIKVAEDEIERLQEEVQELRDNRDIENDTEAQERDERIIELINTLSGQSKSMAKDHDQLVQQKNRLLGELHGRRKDRLDQIEKSGRTFASMVQAFHDEEVRQTQGRHAELVKMSRQKKQKDFRKKSSYPDGSVDNILLDENSETEEQGE